MYGSHAGDQQSKRMRLKGTRVVSPEEAYSLDIQSYWSEGLAGWLDGVRSGYVIGKPNMAESLQTAKHGALAEL